MDDQRNVWASSTPPSPSPPRADELPTPQAAPHDRPTGSMSRNESNPFKRRPVPQVGGALAAESSSHTAAGAKQLPAIPADAFSRLSVSDGGLRSNPWQPIVEAPVGVPEVVVDMPTEEGEVMEDEAHAWDDLGSENKAKAPVNTVSIAENLPEGTSIDDWHVVDHQADATATPKGKGKESSHDVGSELSHDGPRGSASIATSSDERPGPSLPPRPTGDPKAETYQVKNIRWHDAKSRDDTRVTPVLLQNANGPCPLVALVNALTLTTPAHLTDTVLIDTLRSREQVSLDLLLRAVFEELMSGGRLGPNEDYPDIIELHDFLQGLHTGMNVNPRFIPAPELVEAFKRSALTHLRSAEREDMVPGTFENTREMAFYRIFSIPLVHGWLPEKTSAAHEALRRQAESYEDAQNLLFREEELDDKLSNPGSDGLSEEEQSLYEDILIIKSFLNSSATQLTSWGLEVITKAMPPGSVAILFRNDHFSTLYRHPVTLTLLSLVTDTGYATHDEVVWETLVDVKGEKSQFLSGDSRVVSGNAQQESPNNAAGSSSFGQEWTTVQGRKGKGSGRKSGADCDGDGPLSPVEQSDRDMALAMQLQEEENERHRKDQEKRRKESLLSEQFIEQQGRSSQGTASRTTTTTATQQSRVNAVMPGQRTSSSLAPTSASQSSVSLLPIAPSSLQPNRRGSSTTVSLSTRPPQLPRQDGAADNDDAPPTYEQANSAPLYVPPAGHPAHPASPNSSTSMLNLLDRPGSGMTRLSTNGSAMSSANGGNGYGGGAPSPGPRRSSHRQGVPSSSSMASLQFPPSPAIIVGQYQGGAGGGQKERQDRECVVM